MHVDRTSLDPWLKQRLVCPRHGNALAEKQDTLICDNGDQFPCVDGIPVMILDDVDQTHWISSYSLATLADPDPTPVAGDPIDPFVRQAIGATCGWLYVPRAATFASYPIPNFRWRPRYSSQPLLDVGCNWGRWCISASRAGFKVVGIDPSLIGVRAARRVAAQLGVEASFVVGDARYLPFARGTFDVAFSYSVLQHFSKKDATASLAEICRILAPGGRSMIQMPNTYGARNVMQQARRRFADPRAFEVRYWRPNELQSTFEALIGPSRLSVDGFFSLNAQVSDIRLLPRRYQAVVRGSEVLRRVAERAPWLIWAADSLYVESVKRRRPAS